MKPLIALLGFTLCAATPGDVVALASKCDFGGRAGVQAHLEKLHGTTVIANWVKAIDVPFWTVEVPRIGRYSVQVVYAATPASAGVPYTITLQGYSTGMTKGVVQATKGGKLRTFQVGDMELEPGRHRLFVQPENKAGQPAMMLQRVELHYVGN
ncbi:hypothetical protein [uncultured Paludibaculum sp.]|uniref:hypothetical protein n=1 Tax=uncultured Paludibaculum sp. TaxID=1765020 RepID=UPI002AAC1C85|nr:hypothetical protein [uncultured Paludibaculum sp.]